MTLQASVIFKRRGRVALVVVTYDLDKGTRYLRVRYRKRGTSWVCQGGSDSVRDGVGARLSQVRLAPKEALGELETCLAHCRSVLERVLPVEQSAEYLAGLDPSSQMFLTRTGAT